MAKQGDFWFMTAATKKKPSVGNAECRYGVPSRSCTCDRCRKRRTARPMEYPRDLPARRVTKKKSDGPGHRVPLLGTTESTTVSSCANSWAEQQPAKKIRNVSKRYPCPVCVVGRVNFRVALCEPCAKSAKAYNLGEPPSFDDVVFIEWAAKRARHFMRKVTVRKRSHLATRKIKR